MARPKKVSQNNFRPSLKLLVLVVVFVVAAGIGSIVVVRNGVEQEMLRKEENGFNALKQDFLELQKKFNTIDVKWDFSEGCRNDGREFVDSPSSCRFLLTSKEIQDYTMIQKKFSDYTQIMTSSGKLLEDGAVKEMPWSISDKNDTITLSTQHFLSNTFSGSNCNFRDYISDSKQTGGLHLECIHDAHKFYYQRYDK